MAGLVFGGVEFGTNLVAIAGLVSGDNSDVWTSTNGGLTWTDQTAANQAASGPWSAVASNAAGNHLVAIGRGVIWGN